MIYVKHVFNKQKYSMYMACVNSNHSYITGQKVSVRVLCYYCALFWRCNTNILAGIVNEEQDSGSFIYN